MLAGSPPCSPQMPSLIVRARRPAPLGGELDEFADALLVQRHERIVGQQALRRIGAKERRRVVARQAERRLRQVVGAEGEELGALGDLAGPERRARQFDHRADLIRHRDARFLGHLLGHVVDDLLDQVKLGPPHHQRHHDLGRDGRAGLAAGLHRALKDGAGLHLRDLRDSAPPAARRESPASG